MRDEQNNEIFSIHAEIQTQSSGMSNDCISQISHAAALCFYYLAESNFCAQSFKLGLN
jgi:hypothetical protein